MYVSGDTLFYNGLKEIHTRFPTLDLALLHLGGMTLPVINVMLTMDAEQGVQMIHALRPETTIPIHIDDYDLFKSGATEFRRAVDKAEMRDRVMFLERGGVYEFDVSRGIRKVSEEM
ncbi:hypothetical protein BC938DRAFT_484124 [Jimgerdemannia flammicorona]|nr:hypothetical protein BC938DRAFT_484124 [Jimgerdemannia flammicorona]